MIEWNDASLSLGGKPLFAHLTLRLERGHMLCIGGMSGSGKSSLLRTVLGFQPLDAGSVAVGGTLLTVQTVEQLRRQTAYLPQELPLSDLTVGELVGMLFGLKANRMKGCTRDDLLREWALLGLESSLYDHRTAELSGGQRQRILLSMAALLQKPLLLADEPTAALDVASAGLTATYLRRLTDSGTTVVCVTHDRQLMAQADRVLMLGEGGAHASHYPSEPSADGILIDQK